MAVSEPASSDFEGEFRKATLREDADHFKVIAGILIALGIVYAIIDFRLFGPSRTLLRLYLIRGVGAGLTVAMIFLLRAAKSYRAFDRLALAWIVVSLAASLYVDSTRPASFPFHIALDIVIILAVYLLTPGPLVFRFVPAVLYSMGVAAVIQFFRRGIDPVGINAILFSLLAANVFGVLVSERYQRYRRSYFQAGREESRAKAEIQAMLAEKESLLHEVHHRVKNNLQVMSSLMALQAASFEDPRTRDLFRENQERLRSIALIHEKLYRTEEFAGLDFGDFLKDLSGPLVRLFAAGKTIRVRTDAEGVRLPIEIATPCALIVNELITNALKHAFDGRDEGTVSVSLETRDAAAERAFRLRVSDDGVGLAPGFDWRQSPSLGLRLVDILARQMKGTAEATSGHGTTFTIQFARPLVEGKVR